MRVELGHPGEATIKSRSVPEKRFTDARLANEIGRALVGLQELDRVAFGIVDPREPANTRRIPFWIGCDLDSLALESRLRLVEPFDTEVQHPLLGRREIVSVCVERGKDSQ